MRKLFGLFALLLFVLWCPLHAEQGILTDGSACPLVNPTLLTSSTGCVTIGVNGAGTMSVQISGTFVGTLLFETTVDTVNWVSWYVLPNGLTTTVTSATVPGVWEGDTRGKAWVHVRFSPYTSGTAIVTMLRSNF